MKLFLFAAVLAVCFSTAVVAQPRPVGGTEKPTAKAPPAPDVVDVQYTGGMYGFSKKIDGTIWAGTGGDERTDEPAR